jgi:hypothetical protein
MSLAFLIVHISYAQVTTHKNLLYPKAISFWAVKSTKPLPAQHYYLMNSHERYLSPNLNYIQSHFKLKCISYDQTVLKFYAPSNIFGPRKSLPYHLTSGQNINNNLEKN